MLQKPLILAVTLAFGIPGSATAQPDATIDAHITGNTFEMRRLGMRMQMTFLEDGKIAARGPMGEGEGTWTLNGTELCMSTPRGDQCSEVSIASNGGLVMEDGRTLTPAN